MFPFCISIDWSENHNIKSLIRVYLRGHTSCNADNSITTNLVEFPTLATKIFQLVIHACSLIKGPNIEYKTKDKILTTFCCYIAYNSAKICCDAIILF